MFFVHFNTYLDFIFFASFLLLPVQQANLNLNLNLNSTGSKLNIILFLNAFEIDDILQ